MPYMLLALSAFTAQALLIIPIVPVLVSAGAIAARGELDPVMAVLALTAGVVPGDCVWYVLGRRRGARILSRVCRAALEPNTCVRRAQNVLGRYGARTLLIVKFIPGLSTVALPMAGAYQMMLHRFLIYDAIGVLLWCTTYVLTGYLSVRQLTAAGSGSIGPRGVAGIIIIAAAAYFIWKYLLRRRRVRQVRVDRISADELRRRLASGDALVVVDLRHAVDFEADPHAIPGALYIPAEDLHTRYRDIPRRAEVVLYCTCPDEATSVREALKLRARGIRRVRPLEGGFDAWREQGYPVERRGPTVAPENRILNAA